MQINFNVTAEVLKGTDNKQKETDKGLMPPNSGLKMTGKALAEQVRGLKALAKRTDKGL